MTNSFIENIRENKQQIGYCMIATFLWGMLAHAYIFFNNPFSHDSLNEFNGAIYGNDWRIQLGRVFVPVYRAIVRTAATLPWLIGIVSLIWIGLSVFLIVKLFNMESKVLIVLIAGILTVNSTVTATAATYIHDLDCNMFALFLSVLAVYFWYQYKNGFLIGMLCVGGSLGFYQSFISVTITLVMIICIMALVNGKCFSAVMGMGMKAVGMLMGGGVFYWLALKSVCALTGVSLASGGYNSLDTVFSLSMREVLYSILRAYTIMGDGILNVNSAYPDVLIRTLHYGLLGVIGITIICRIFSKEILVKAKLLILVLLALLPLGMNLSCVLTGGMCHDLMQYAFWMIYIFALLCVQCQTSRIKCIPMVLIGVILWGNVQASNAVYMNKNLAWDANLSLFTRILYRMEEQKEYVTGETQVVFVGEPVHLLEKIPELEYGYEFTGANGNYVLGAAKRDYYQAYFDYVLQNPAIMADEEAWDEMQDKPLVEEMPSYPEEGCIKMMDGILVVKLGDLY